MGVLNSYTKREFLRCDRKYVIGNVSLWKSASFANYLRKITQDINNQDHFVIVNNLGIKEDEKIFRRKTGYKVHTFPFLENPFHLVTTTFGLFESLLRASQ